MRHYLCKMFLKAFPDGSKSWFPVTWKYSQARFSLIDRHDNHTCLVSADLSDSEHLSAIADPDISYLASDTDLETEVSALSNHADISSALSQYAVPSIPSGATVKQLLDRCARRHLLAQCLGVDIPGIQRDPMRSPDVSKFNSAAAKVGLSMPNTPISDAQAVNDLMMQQFPALKTPWST